MGATRRAGHRPARQAREPEAESCIRQALSKSVNLEAGYLTVARPLLPIAASIVEGKPTTHAGERQVWLYDHTIALLHEHRKRQLSARLAAGPAWQDNDLIFCRDDGTPWRPDYVTRNFKVIAKAAGLPVIKLHRAAWLETLTSTRRSGARRWVMPTRR